MSFVVCFAGLYASWPDGLTYCGHTVVTLDPETSSGIVGAQVSAAVSEEQQEQLKENTLEEGLENHSTQGSHGVNYHHPEQGDTGYQFFMPSRACRSFVTPLGLPQSDVPHPDPDPLFSAVNYMGKNSLVGASQQIKDLGLKKALIVTDAVRRLVFCLHPSIPKTRGTITCLYAHCNYPCYTARYWSRLEPSKP